MEYKKIMDFDIKTPKNKNNNVPPVTKVTIEYKDGSTKVLPLKDNKEDSCIVHVLQDGHVTLQVMGDRVYMSKVIIELAEDISRHTGMSTINLFFELARAVGMADPLELLKALAEQAKRGK